jgi:hypothetical protein
LHKLQIDKDDKQNEILEIDSRLSKCNSEMAAISNKLSDAEKSMNKLIKDRSEYILINMKKLNEGQESRFGINTNRNNYKALLHHQYSLLIHLNSVPV